MESDWALQHLQVIRTLMERSAVYRRALAPVMTYNGVIGLLGTVVGYLAKFDQPRSFILFWAAVAALALAVSFLFVRSQALKESEPFWSPPTRRVTLAMLPPLVVGFVLSAFVWFKLDGSVSGNAVIVSMVFLPIAWVILYGCAFHAAGFFMPRGMRLFGWGLVLGGCALLVLNVPDHVEQPRFAYGVMGLFFGLLHLAYGVYLYFTEPRRDET